MSLPVVFGSKSEKTVDRSSIVQGVKWQCVVVIT